MSLISGEQLQHIADIYLGLSEDFTCNPFIHRQTHKHKNILEINNFYDNPKIVFCYTPRINILSEKIKYFMNNFILITHNSDENISYDKKLFIENICSCDKLLKWFTQNLCITNEKMHFLPIGIANNMWSHGSSFNYFYKNIYSNLNININDFSSLKKHSIYFLFKISTNREKRMECYNSLNGKIPFLNFISPLENFKRMNEYEFCICPDGNGIDTHRFWECLYLKCVPIVIRNPLIEILSKNTNLPMVILDSWNQFNRNNLPEYKTFDFAICSKYLNIDYYINSITNV